MLSHLHDDFTSCKNYVCVKQTASTFVNWQTDLHCIAEALAMTYSLLFVNEL
jgi:hypothetical protein